jgi:hypothetical protein
LTRIPAAAAPVNCLTKKNMNDIQNTFMQKEVIAVVSLTVLRDMLANMTEIEPAFVRYQ